MTKITGVDFTNLQKALIDTLTAHNLHPFMVKSNAQAWQVFHKASDEGRVNLNELYRSYNDVHLETAFRRIFKV